MSSPPTPPFTRPAAEPSLRDLLNLHKKEIMLALNCHAVATVQSFNSTLQTVTATLNYQRTQNVRDSVTGIYSTVLQSYPILVDVPVLIPHGGSASLTFPVAAGDQCLILFNDRDIDNWFQGNNNSGPATTRLHSFSDGFALIGPRSMNSADASYDTTRAVLKNGSTLVGVGSSHVKIANAGTTLNTLLQTLITDLKALTVVVSGSSGTVSPTTVAALTAVATQIGNLLE